MLRRTGCLALAFVLVPACDGDKKDDAAKPAAGDKKDDEPTGFTAYKLKSMASEASVNIRAIATGVSAAYETESLGPDGQLVGNQLPVSAPATPPAGSCCKQDEGKCPHDPELWKGEPWQSIGFEPTVPLRYSYALEVEGDSFTVRAIGDLDCDGKLSDYALSGRVENGSVVLDSEPKIADPLE